MAEKLERKDFDARFDAGLQARQSWEPTWRDVADYLAPRKARFSLDDTNKGTRKDSKIINSYATKALRVGTAGMHAGITSPARPWFHFTIPNPKLMDLQNVKVWLYDAEARMRLVFAQSNLYKCLASMYEDMLAFGTGAMIVEEDAEDTVRGFNRPVGQYWLGTDDRGVVNCYGEEVRMTVSQVVRKFGYDKCSSGTQTAFDAGRIHDPVDVRHVIEPRYDRDITKVDAGNKPFRSVWWEKGGDGSTFLVISGYDEFPVLVGRWNVTGNDVYGWGPGQDALGDIKALQTLEKRKGQLVDKITNPPMKGPSSLRNQRSSLLPGDITYVDSTTGGATFEPAQKVEYLSPQVVGEEAERHQKRIGDVFLVNMWMMMSESDRREITAREVDERHEEKMLQIGPTLERLHDEVLDELIDRVFAIMLRQGKLPEIPRELGGATLKVEYVSIMAKAQQVLSVGSVDRLVAFVGNISNVRPEVLDTVNFDEAVKHYADSLGTKPQLVRATDEVVALRQARQQAQAKQAQLEQAAQAAKAAQSLARAPTDEDNALTQMMGGPAAAQASPLAGPAAGVVR